MSQDKPAQPPQQPPVPATQPEQPKKRKLALDIDEVDVSEVLERKISA